MTHSIERHYAECRYAECRDYLNVLLSVITLNVIMLSVVALSGNMLSVVAPQISPAATFSERKSF
jgi:hypothetical protein